MRLAAETGTAPVSRVRVCLCGFEGVGKTTLNCSLQGKQSDALERTMGIDITNMAVADKAFCIWDYGGTGFFDCIGEELRHYCNCFFCCMSMMKAEICIEIYCLCL